jgi:uncharacterized membrane protein YcaP (DUF421 family)
MMFESWASMGHVALRVVIVYLAIVAVFRIIGEQALAKMSAYDLIVSITLGELVASIPLTHDLALLDGLAAILVFVGLQELIRWAQSRSKKIRAVVVEEPRLIVWNGEILADRLHKWNLTKREVLAAVRDKGLAHLDQAQAVVLENDGEWSVVERTEGSEHGSAFEDLDVPGRHGIRSGEEDHVRTET